MPLNFTLIAATHCILQVDGYSAYTDLAKARAKGGAMNRSNSRSAE
ncbi:MULTISPECIES: hypothetical protein [unclassified Mesorhizobium]|nr:MULTISPECIES: hypothetical protein [unclassified Mesorhizobium]